MPDLWGNGELSISEAIDMERRIARMTERVKQLESTISQVSKALCGKENATPDELLQAADQLKYRLAQVERERDAAVADLAERRNCADCKHYYESVFDEPCSSCVADEETKKSWQWRGVCPENTKED